jgi:hypothetical protein
MIDDGNERDRSPESGPHVPQERPDPDAAGRKPGPDAIDRPGADLGGAVGDRTTIGSNIIPGGPRDPLPTSTEAGSRPHAADRIQHARGREPCRFGGRDRGVRRSKQRR